MENTLATTKQELTAEGKIRTAWGNLGGLFVSIKAELQIMADQSLAKIPETVTDISAAELLLKEVKKDQTLINEKRKSITGKFDILTKQAMVAENSLDSPIIQFTNKIIAAKKIKQEEEGREKLKTDQLRQCKEYLANYKNGKTQVFNKTIVDTVDKAYTFALGEGNITMETLPAFLEKTTNRFSEATFTITGFINTFSTITPEQFTILSTELLVNDPKEWLTLYATKLREKFSDYEIAVNNKIQALENARIEKEATEKVLADKKLMDETVAKLAGAAITPVLVGAKPLKSAWRVDNMPDQINSILIITAFVSNFDKCQSQLRITVWDSLSVKQMRTALEKVKTLDENFAPQGIIFKQIDKL